jgi:ankyrin repeat protein
LLLRVCRSNFHRLGWITHQLNALRENIPSRVSDILEKVGTPQGEIHEKFTQALRDIPGEKYQYTSRLFQCLVAATRLLSLKELAEISAELDPNAGPHEDAVLSACPALIARDKDHPAIVQFSHESLKGFLTSSSSRLQTSSPEKYTSRYHFSSEAANATLARVCINVLLRIDDTADKTQLMENSPLALYAAQNWVQHTRQGNAATENQGVMERLFDPSKSHFDAWIWMHDVDKGQSRTMGSLAERPSQRSATPLYYAALCGFTELVKHLASLRPEDSHDSHGYYGTPLHAASYMGHYGVVLALLDSDPMMVYKIGDNQAPLHAAYYGKHKQLEIIELLLKRGAHVDAKGTLDNTLLHCASLDGRTDVVKLLLENKADVSAKNKNGWTPLHQAALRGRLEVAKYLLNFKPKDEKYENPDVNVQSNKKNTPLHIAAMAGKLQMVDLLLRYDAETGIMGEHGWTPLDAAEKNRHKSIVARLSRGRWVAWWAGSDFRRVFDMSRRRHHDEQPGIPGFV